MKGIFQFYGNDAMTEKGASLFVLSYWLANHNAE
jgi:hypothetical protein